MATAPAPAATTAGTSRPRVIDAGPHVTEPRDLWTSRMSARTWGDAIPTVRFDSSIGRAVDGSLGSLTVSDRERTRSGNAAARYGLD